MYTHRKHNIVGWWWYNDDDDDAQREESLSCFFIGIKLLSSSFPSQWKSEKSSLSHIQSRFSLCQQVSSTFLKEIAFLYCFATFSHSVKAKKHKKRLNNSTKSYLKFLGSLFACCLHHKHICTTQARILYLLPIVMRSPTERRLDSTLFRQSMIFIIFADCKSMLQQELSMLHISLFCSRRLLRFSRKTFAQWRKIVECSNSHRVMIVSPNVLAKLALCSNTSLFSTIQYNFGTKEFCKNLVDFCEKPFSKSQAYVLYEVTKKRSDSTEKKWTIAK